MVARPAARAALLVVALVAVLGVAGPAGSNARSQRELALLAAINEARAELGLGPLGFSDRLDVQAQARASSLLATGRLAHGELRAGQGELIAWGTLGTMGPRQVVRRWLASDRHASVLLLGRLRSAGVGLVLGSLEGSRVRVAVVRISL